MLARVLLCALILIPPAAPAAELGIHAVVITSARVSVQPRRVVLTASTPHAVRVAVLPAGGVVRVVFTP